MKQLKWIKTVFGILAVLFFSEHVFAGKETGNGTDIVAQETDSAWFVGKDKDVHYCIVRSPDFSVNLTTIEKEVSDALAKWALYYNVKYLDRTSPNLPDPLVLATGYYKSEKCDESTDLTFYFGTTNAEIEKARAKYQKPIGLAEPTSYDRAKGWGRGFIWIAHEKSIEPWLPNWQTKNALQGVLLHEIGHVYGVGHIAGTIMSDDYTSLLIAHPDSSENRFLAQINHWVEVLPVTWSGKGIRYYSNLWPSEAAGGRPDPELFKLLVGRAPEGKITARLKTDETSGKGELRLTDNDGDTHTYISIDLFERESEMRRPFGPPVFKVVRDEVKWKGNTYLGRVWANSYSISRFGTMRLPTGEEVTVVIEHNTPSVNGVFGALPQSHGRVSLGMLRHKKVIPIFIASLTGK